MILGRAQDNQLFFGSIKTDSIQPSPFVVAELTHWNMDAKMKQFPKVVLDFIDLFQRPSGNVPNLLLELSRQIVLTRP